MAYGKVPLWRRRWVLIVAGLFVLLLLVGALAGDPDERARDRAARAGDPATPTSTPTPDPADEAHAAAALLVDDGDYVGAVAVLEDAGLSEAADRVRRRGTRVVLTVARRALRRGRYEVAKATALDARQIAHSGAVRTVLSQANAGIARERAAARERRRLARIAHDLRTCTAGEKADVRIGNGVPAGCSAFAVQVEARRAEREAEEQARQAEASACAPGYSPCIPSYPPDLDCADTGPVTVSGSDPHGLDADRDGVACGGD
jgi:hypothetical protein